MKSYTASEVLAHNNQDSAWIIIHEHIYNVTKFLDEHPGGREILLDYAGMKASQCFDDIGHSAEAKSLMNAFKIGVLCDHPGGEEVLLEQAGKDASEAFEDVGHSSEAREMMLKYKVGELTEAEKKNLAQKTTSETPKWTDSTPSSSSFKSWLVPIALAIFATLLYRYFFTK